MRTFEYLTFSNCRKPVYCLKAIPTSSFLENVITAAGVIIPMAVHAWKRNTILSVVCGSAAYILLWNLL